MRMRGHHLLHSSVFTVSFGFFATSAILKETNTRTTIMERNSDHCVETGNLIQFYYATITLSYVVFIRLIYKFIELLFFFLSFYSFRIGLGHQITIGSPLLIYLIIIGA